MIFGVFEVFCYSFFFNSLMWIQFENKGARDSTRWRRSSPPTRALLFRPFRELCCETPSFGEIVSDVLIGCKIPLCTDWSQKVYMGALESMKCSCTHSTHSTHIMRTSDWVNIRQYHHFSSATICKSATASVLFSFHPHFRTGCSLRLSTSLMKRAAHSHVQGWLWCAQNDAGPSAVLLCSDWHCQFRNVYSENQRFGGSAAVSVTSPAAGVCPCCLLINCGRRRWLCCLTRSSRPLVNPS